MEYIEGISLYYLKDFDETIIIRVFAALHTSKKIQFTHYDLNLHNIMIKKLPSKIKIKCFDFEILTDIIPVIIDYEMSHINIRGIDYGVNLEQFNIYSSTLYPVIFLAK